MVSFAGNRESLVVDYIKLFKKEWWIKYVLIDRKKISKGDGPIK